MPRKICDVCNIRPVGTGPISNIEDPEFAAQNGMCFPCGDMQQVWISHHNDKDMCEAGTCWICKPELDKTKETYVVRTRKGHHSPRRPTINHRTQCSHAQLPAARKACRAQWWAWLANQSTEFINSFNKG